MAIGFQNLIQSEYTTIVLKSLWIILIAFILNFLSNLFFKARLKRILKKRPVEERRLKQTRVNFLRLLISSLIFILALIQVLLLIPGFKTLSISLIAGAGIAAIVIGFAAQKTLANIVSGLSISLFTPFRLGDRIKAGEDFGDVEEINLRHTVIKTWDNRRVIIPNSIMSEREIINYSIKEEKMLWTVNMGISYDSDIDKAKSIMTKLAKKHPDVIIPEVKDEDGNLEKKEPRVRVTDCGDFAVNLRLYFWVEKPNKAWGTGFDLIEQIKKEFDKQGIEIPFPYRTIVYKNDLEKDKKYFKNDEEKKKK